MTCSCKTIKKEFHCEYVRNGTALVECDEVCEQKRIEEKKKNEELEKQRKKEEELRNKKELEKYEKMFSQKKKNRKRTYTGQERKNLIQQCKYVLAGATFLIILIVVIVYQTFEP